MQDHMPDNITDNKQRSSHIFGKTILDASRIAKLCNKNEIKKSEV